MEVSMEVYENLKVELPYDLDMPLFGMYPKECKPMYKGIPVHPCLLQHYSQ
jgi:hypothetical protein